MSSDKQIFSEQEVTALLRRAVEIEQAEQASVYTPGVTREELQRIAAEIGLSPAALQRALMEGPPKKATKAGVSMTETFERVVEGELDPDDFDVVQQAAPPMNGIHGAKQVGRTLEIRTWNGSGNAVLTVSSRSGRTRITARSESVFPIMMTMYPAFMGFIFMLALMNRVEALATGLALTLFAVVGCRAMIRRNNQQTADLVDRVQRAVAEHLTHKRPMPSSLDVEPPSELKTTT